MSAVLRRHPRKIAAGATLVAAIYFHDYLPNPMRTYGVQNIEKRYTAGGAGPNHTPATASKLGDHDSIVGNVDKSRGVGTPHFEANFNDQRGERSPVKKKLDEASYNTPKGK